MRLSLFGNLIPNSLPSIGRGSYQGIDTKCYLAFEERQQFPFILTTDLIFLLLLKKNAICQSHSNHFAIMSVCLVEFWDNVQYFVCVTAGFGATVTWMVTLS